ncbi:MAG: ABC transporter substrate-binding protein, partial [Spirochaetota bacterium]
QTLEAATLTPAYKRLELDITLRAWTNDMVDASQQVDYACVYANIKNFSTGWQDAKVEKLASDAKSELDNSKRRAMYYQIQELYQQAMPMVTLFHVPYPVAMKKNLKGFVQTPLGNYRFENLVLEQ